MRVCVCVYDNKKECETPSRCTDTSQYAHVCEYVSLHENATRLNQTHLHM